MQINGAQLATAFTPKLSTLQEKAREPITIDAKAFSESLSSSTDDKPVVARQAPLEVNEQQQAQFVRFFSVNEPSSAASNKESTPQTTPNSLPKGVQQYLQVAATSISNEPQQGILDELV